MNTHTIPRYSGDAKQNTLRLNARLRPRLGVELLVKEDLLEKIIGSKPMIMMKIDEEDVS